MHRGRRVPRKEFLRSFGTRRRRRREDTGRRIRTCPCILQCGREQSAWRDSASSGDERSRAKLTKGKRQMHAKEHNANAIAMVILRMGVGLLFLIFGEYKVFGTQFTLHGGFSAGSISSSPRELIPLWFRFFADSFSILRHRSPFSWLMANCHWDRAGSWNPRARPALSVCSTC